MPPTLLPLLQGRPGLGEYLAVDDHDVIYAAKVWARASDWILADLARRFLERRLFKPVYKVHPTSIPRERLSEVAALLVEEGWPPEYYLAVDDVSGAAYDLYEPELTGKRKKPILVLDEMGRPQEITRLSPTMRALSMGPKVAVNIYVPETVVERARKLLMA